MEIHQLPPLLSSREAAEFLNIKSRTLDAWRFRRQGPKWIKCGRLARYRSADLAAWLESRDVAPSVVISP